MKRFYSQIAGIGSYLPETTITNEDLARTVDTSPDWILERTGIRERHIAKNGMVTSDFAAAAAKKAMANAGIDSNEIDLILVATITPDYSFPPTACLVQSKLGLRRAAAFDVVAVCSGFLYGLSVADHFLRNGAYRHILVIGVEMLSRIVDWEDRASCILFGDGAGAVVLRASDEPGILSTHLFADGANYEYLWLPAGGSKNPATEETLAKRMHYIKMTGSEVYKIAVRAMYQACREAMDENRLSAADIDHFVPHQANLRIITSTADKLAVPMDKVVVTVDRHANTSAASIPLALDHAAREGRFQKGDTILMASFGGGFTWSSAVLRW